MFLAENKCSCLPFLLLLREDNVVDDDIDVFTAPTSHPVPELSPAIVPSASHNPRNHVGPEEGGIWEREG